MATLYLQRARYVAQTRRLSPVCGVVAITTHLHLKAPCLFPRPVICSRVLSARGAEHVYDVSALVGPDGRGWPAVTTE